MNTSADNLFHSEFIRNTQFNGWFKKPSSDKTQFNGWFEKSTPGKLNACDYNKHYTSNLIGQDVKFGCPVYSVFDEIVPFDGKIEAGYYHVETDNFFPFHGNGFYDADLIQFSINEKIIKLNQIKYQHKSFTVLPITCFKNFIEEVYKTFENPKAAINAFIGTFGHDYKSRINISLLLILNFILKNGNVIQIYKLNIYMPMSLTRKRRKLILILILINLEFQIIFVLKSLYLIICMT
jgi:hypothetical protein